MSGITPIIDTLLHQVLGRRDGPAERPLPETLIVPVQDSHAAQKTYSDSRLDPRPLPPALGNLRVGTKATAATLAKAPPGAPSTTPQAATTTRFSGAARTIANLLARFPAPPSALHATAPLLNSGQHVDTTQLAALLRSSIASSGLFYEAHLNRWRSGALPLARLALEPQMRLAKGPAGNTPPAPGGPSNTPATAPAPGVPTNMPTPTLPGAVNTLPLLGAVPAHADARVGATGNTPAGTVANAALPAMAGHGTAISYTADGRPLTFFPYPAAATVDTPAANALATIARQDSPVHAGLEGVLRHQLELLAIPVLRWEGAPWVGMALAMTIQPPPYHQDPDAQHEDPHDAYREDEPWQSKLTLHVATLGEIGVQLRLGTQRLALQLDAAPAAAERMRAAADALRNRLGALGFQDVTLKVQARTNTGVQTDA